MQTLITPFKLSVAPMLDWTDRHCRYFLRLIAPDIHLYTEMITMQALTFGDAKRLLAFSTQEKYVALQLGGNDPTRLALCAKMGEEAGYDEINLNVGCPSPRVSSGNFGACLMLEPYLVAKCVSQMQANVSIPVTVKCRIGVDHQDSYPHLYQFIDIVSQSGGCRQFIVHARKAWLSGLSPKQNREIPPLQYDIVKQLKKDFPHLTIILNGGIKTLAQVIEHAHGVDGIMIGREAYTNPFMLADLQAHFFPHTKLLNREEVILAFCSYVQRELGEGVRLSSMTRHILGLYQGLRGAANWRRYISERAHLPNADVEVVKGALALVATSQG